MAIACPHCSQEIEVSLKESLAPYSMTYTIRPELGRMVSAKTAAGGLDALVDLLKACGNEVGHETVVHLTGASVGDDMSVSFTVSATPILPAKQGA